MASRPESCSRRRRFAHSVVRLVVCYLDLCDDYRNEAIVLPIFGGVGCDLRED